MFELERSVTATQSLWDRETFIFPAIYKLQFYQRAFSSPLRIQNLFPSDTRGNASYKIFIFRRGKDRSTWNENQIFPDRLRERERDLGSIYSNTAVRMQSRLENTLLSLESLRKYRLSTSRDYKRTKGEMLRV